MRCCLVGDVVDGSVQILAQRFRLRCLCVAGELRGHKVQPHGQRATQPTTGSQPRAERRLSPRQATTLQLPCSGRRCRQSMDTTRPRDVNNKLKMSESTFSCTFGLQRCTHCCEINTGPHEFKSSGAHSRVDRPSMMAHCDRQMQDTAAHISTQATSHMQCLCRE